MLAKGNKNMNFNFPYTCSWKCCKSPDDMQELLYMTRLDLRSSTFCVHSNMLGLFICACVCVCVQCVYWLWTDGHLHLLYCYCRARLLHSVQHSSRTSEHLHSATKSQQKCRHCQCHGGGQWNLHVSGQKDTTTDFSQEKKQGTLQVFSFSFYTADP